MQAKETSKAQIKTVVSSVTETGNRSALRTWITPIFERLPLKDALSGVSGNGKDNGYYS